MKEALKTKAELLKELKGLRKKVTTLESIVDKQIKSKKP